MPHQRPPTTPTTQQPREEVGATLPARIGAALPLAPVAVHLCPFLRRYHGLHLDDRSTKTQLPLVDWVAKKGREAVGAAVEPRALAENVPVATPLEAHLPGALDEGPRLGVWHPTAHFAAAALDLDLLDLDAIPPGRAAT